MATKDYTKGLARRCWDLSRYINKYQMGKPIPTNSNWTTTLQTDATQMAADCDAITAQIAFREQP